MAEPFVVRREVDRGPAADHLRLPDDPEKILRWMGTEATAEPHPGGLYLVKGIGSGHTAEAGSREVMPVHRLAYSFGWKGDGTICRRARA